VQYKEILEVTFNLY